MSPVLYHWPRELDDRLVKLCAAGVKRKVIALALDRPLHAIASRIDKLRALGRIPYRHKPWTTGDCRRLRGLVAEGLGYREIADELGRTPRAVKARALELRLAAAPAGPEDEDQLTLELQAA